MTGGTVTPPAWQFAFVGYFPLVSANVSLIGSFLITYSILGPGRAKQLQKPHMRLLLGMSFWDMLYSFVMAYTFLFAPKGYGMPGALGNLTTCRIQGFFSQMSHQTGAYNALLSTYYWLTVCRGMKNDTWVRFEPFMHILISTYFITLGGVALWINLYNPVFSFCWINTFPPGCETGPGTPPCIHHSPEEMGFLNDVFANIYLQFYIGVIVLTNFLIWWKVYSQERTSRLRTRALELRQIEQRARQASVVGPRSSALGFSFTSSTSSDPSALLQRKRRRDRQVLVQSALYAGCFLLSWIGPVLFHYLPVEPHFSFMALVAIFTPMQGFFNAFVYARPTYYRIRRKYPRITGWDAVKRIFLAEDPLAPACSLDGNPSRIPSKPSSDQSSATIHSSNSFATAGWGPRRNPRDEFVDEDFDFDPNDPASCCETNDRIMEEDEGEYVESEPNDLPARYSPKEDAIEEEDDKDVELGENDSSSDNKPSEDSVPKEWCGQNDCSSYNKTSEDHVDEEESHIDVRRASF